MPASLVSDILLDAVGARLVDCTKCEEVVSGTRGGDSCNRHITQAFLGKFLKILHVDMFLWGMFCLYLFPWEFLDFYTGKLQGNPKKLNAY